MTGTEVTLTLRRVHKEFDGFAPAKQETYYVVQEHGTDSDEGSHLGRAWVGWCSVTKRYAHSTSAYAAMGRLYQREIKELQELDLL